MIALAFNALAPIHLAFDLAEMLGSQRVEGSSIARHGLEWRLLAVLSGRLDGGEKSDHHGKHRPAACAVCASLGVLGGVALAAAMALSAPAAVAAAVAFAATDDEPGGACALAYRSRAPPLA